MNRLKQKLKSESGASILLAMLFFMICALVASALLMAAVSNAGKIKSNQEMHQKYLAVSSAMELVCDDLLSAEYRGQYTVSIEKQTKPLAPESGGGTIETYVYHYTQTGGKYECKLGDMLIDELDDIFATQMKADVAGFQRKPNIENVVSTKPFPGTENRTHTLTVKVGEDGVDMQEVKVVVSLDRKLKSYTINLTARLVDDAAYGMEAELTPATSSIPQVGSMKEGSPEGMLYQTEPMKWKLGWISKAAQQ